MINYANCNPRLLDQLDSIVSCLKREAGIAPGQLMVIGAAARDIIHSALGHKSELRHSNDSDLGIALENWEAFSSIDNAFSRTGNTGIRYLIAHTPVDIMPFGPIEKPKGYSLPSNRKEPVSVFGFEDVFHQAGHLHLPSGLSVRIPTPSGYALLKLRAWIDRSPTGIYKDSSDLATVAYWYRTSQIIEDQLWNDAALSEPSLLSEHGFSVDFASLLLLNRDIRALLTSESWNDLKARWNRSNLDLFAHYFHVAEHSNFQASEVKTAVGLLLNALPPMGALDF